MRAGFFRGLFAGILSVSMLVIASSEGLAVPITVPTGLNIGDSYRIAFLTSTQRDATSTDIADYNAFVTAAANANPELATLGATWTAIASTSTMSARDNTNTNPISDAGVSIFLLNDTLLANDNIDLWDGNIQVAFNIGTNGSVVQSSSVWVGTNLDGTSHTRALGTAFVQIGSPNAASAAWALNGFGAPSATRNFYAISNELTVVPEPGAAILLGFGLVGLAARRRHS